MFRQSTLHITKFILSVLLVAGAFDAVAQTVATPLVSVEWLRQNPATNDRVLIDLRDLRSYSAGHIPGAVHSDYGNDGWRQTIKDVPGLLPTDGPGLKQLVRKIGQLGIGSQSHVVLIAPGWSAGDMGMATRLYWSFKVLGHDRVSILDGGMAAWQSMRKPGGKTPLNPVRSGVEKNSARIFVPALRMTMLMDREAVKSARARGEVSLDARPTMQYLGLQKSGAVRSAGTLPGAVSLPGQWLTDNGGGYFRKTSSLKKLATSAGLVNGGPLFVFCNTGHWASITWFVTSELLGGKNIRMYDGSLADWTARNNAPLERKINLN